MRTNWGATTLALGLAAFGMTTMLAQTPAPAGAKISIEQHEGFMKAISTANAALGKKVMNNDLPAAAKDAQEIAAQLGNVEKFWAQHNKKDAIAWAQEGQKSATALSKALSSGNAESVAALRKQVSNSCSSCHNAYREGTPGAYTLKAGAI